METNTWGPLVLVILLGHLRSSGALVDPFSWGIVIGGSSMGLAGIYSGYGYVKCKMYECCNEQWIKPNMTGLEEALSSKLHGQHLAKEVVMKALRPHLRSQDPKKALVLSLHGWTGSGKNYVSQIIADHLFVEGLKSKFVHVFISTLHFPHKDMVNVYRDNLVSWIQGNISNCERSLFIFDEVDKMPPNLIDCLKPFIDYHVQIEGKNYRRAIFLFLSNTGGNDITNTAFNAWERGESRETLTMKSMESLITQGAFNEGGGLRYSQLIESNLINFYIPFLPLERRHVKLCIRDELRLRNIEPDAKLVDTVADELLYFPNDSQLYSKSGCKLVPHKVDLVLEID